MRTVDFLRLGGMSAGSVSAALECDQRHRRCGGRNGHVDFSVEHRCWRKLMDISQTVPMKTAGEERW